jgi:hypothetical protein
MMLCARLSKISTVLTAAGWCKPESQSEIFGVDRHGKVVSRPVSFAHSSQSAKLVFLSSKDSFGYFSAATRLVDSTGASRLASSLVEAGQISDVRFETVVNVSGIAPSHDSASGLWTSFSNFAAITTQTVAVLRCRSPNKKLMNVVEPFLSVRRFGQHYYCIVLKDRFIAALCNDWLHTADTLASKWLSTSDGILQFHRDQFLFALWVLSSRKARNQGVALQFETRQHTTCILLAPAGTQNFSGGAGASCFYVPTEEQPLEIRWEDRSWNPVSSGFLLAST